MGLLTAIRLAKLEFGDMTLSEAFEKAGLSPSRAKIHASKVSRFKLGTRSFRT